jgi:UDP-N-acetylmuramyl pentapeptide synthase
MVAEKLGMTLEEIRSAAEKIDMSSEYLLQRKEGVKGAIFIDDSYSANPDGVIAALEYLEEAYPEKKKMLVFPGIIELGKDSREIHQKIWKKTDDICHSAFILQDEDEEIRKDYQKCSFVFEKDFDKMTEEVLRRIDADSVVLFESRGAGVVMKKLSEYNMTKDA